MKMFSDCSGECCVCANGNGCLAGHGDDDFRPASSQQIIGRLNNGEYPNYRQTMIAELAKRGIVYGEQKTAEWIKVSERLPDSVEYDWVLVNIMFNEDGSFGVPNVAECRKGEWWDFFDNKLSDLDITVTHWMPLPPFPEAEK